MFSKSSFLLLALSACSVKAATDCFTQVGNATIKPAGVNHRVSVGADCRDGSSKDPSCNLESSGYVTEPATLNITTDSSTKIYDAVRQKVEKPFNDTLTGGVSGVSYNIHSQTAGYIGFTTTMRCYVGTVGDCIGGDVEAGTAVEACTPTIADDDFSNHSPDGSYYMKGTFRLVNSTAAEVANMTTNPADSNPEGPDSGAGHLSLGAGAVSIIVAGLVFGLF